MSEWIEVTDQGDVELSKDGKDLEILIGTDEWGAKYVTIPVPIILGTLWNDLVKKCL